jgi:aryl-alcohol dehydrogenase-like predicted oxidoreductase
VAAEHELTVAQLAIAWAATQGPDIVPLVGARTRDQLAETLGATTVRLGTNALSAVEEAVPPGSAAGARYMPALLELLGA